MEGHLLTPNYKCEPDSTLYVSRGSNGFSFFFNDRWITMSDTRSEEFVLSTKNYIYKDFSRPGNMNCKLILKILSDLKAFFIFFLRIPLS